MAGEVSFFELGVDDAERGRVFYEGLLGWSFERGPSGDGWVIGTPTGTGGMHPGDRGATPYLFFRVDDLDQALVRVRELGGTFDDSLPEGDADSQRTFGRYKLCTDDQGSPFGLHQPPAVG